jgi:AraC-like DNA-binding protein
MLEMPGRSSITQIAFSCGFNSSQYFSNAFRKRYGHAPNAAGSRRTRESP